MTKPRRNGSSDVVFYGSSLPADALRILAGLSCAEVLALHSMVRDSYLASSDYAARLGAIRKVEAAAEVCG